MPKRNRGAYLKWIENRQSWYVVWYEGGRERKKSAGTRNRLEAEQALSQHIIEKDQPNDIVNPTRRVLADVLAAYASEHAVHVVSAASIGFNIKALIPFWGHRTVGDVRPVLCREYLGYRRDTARRKARTLPTRQ